MTYTTRTALLAAVAALLLAGPAVAQTADMMEKLGYENVKTVYGAKGDGKTDDTEALRKAGETRSYAGRRLYLPAGEYIVTDRVLMGQATWRRMTIVGDGPGKTIIRLADNSPGFDDPAKPKSVISLFPMEHRKNMGQAFANKVRNLSIVVGKGNPGAIALNYMTNNWGTVENVRLASADGGGKAGLALITPWPGPCLIKGIEIEGFDYGIWSDQFQYSVTLEDLRLRNCREAGIHNRAQKLVIRGLSYDGTASAIDCRGGSLVLLDSALTGQGNRPAVRCDAPAFLRNVRVTGFASAFVGEDHELGAGTIKEFGTKDVRTVGTERTTSLRLPVKPTPAFGWPDLKEWADPRDFGAEAATKKSNNPPQQHAFQKAIDSGARVLFIPPGAYKITEPIILRRNIELVVGPGQIAAHCDEPSTGAFRVADGAAPQVTFYDIDIRGKSVGVDHTSDRTVLFKSCYSNGYHGHGRGDVFIEDVGGHPWTFARGQHVWARQWNTEHPGTNITATGATLWVLGLKTEKGYTVADLRGGTMAELLGIYTYHRGKAPAFLVEDSVLAASCLTSGGGGYGTTAVVEQGGRRHTHKGGTGTLLVAGQKR
jgi:hypothetical protein